MKLVKLPRLASLLLTALTVISIMTSAVYGAVKESAADSSDYPFVYVNPRYLDKHADSIIDEPLCIILDDYVEESFPTYAAATVYEDIDEAADYLRECFANRQETITLYMKTKYGSDDDASMIACIIEEHTGSPKYGDYIAFQYSTFQYTYKYDQRRRSYSYTFDVSYYTTAEQEALVDEKIQQVIKDLKLDDASDYRKIRSIYDYIASNVTYNKRSSGETKYTAYGALCEGSSVCQGYATLFYRMCLELGIDSRIITGTGNGESHAWNIVKLDDKYYLCDVTWDSPISYYHEYFLRSENGFAKHKASSAFTTDEFKELYPISDTELLGNNDYIDWDVSGGVLNVSSDYDIAFRDNEESAPWSVNSTSINKLVIGGDIRVIGSRSFEGLANLTDVTFGENTTDIGYWSFAWCSKLESITVPDSVVSIGKYAFYNCKSLSEIKLSSNLKVIDEGAFYNCTSLKSVVLPEGIKRIETNAFACPVDYVTIPRSIDSAACIASGAFTYKGRVTVRCYEDSYAVEYCKKYNIKYEIIEEVIGDVNGDGKFTEEDLSLITDVISGNAALDSAAFEAADVYKDGVIDIKDFNIIYSRIHNN